jgi:tripartite-type tricarboxylate transporter receptor subunit TctC
MVHVPFRGTGQAVTEILAGRIDIALDTLPTYLPHIRAGAVRAIAVTHARARRVAARGARPSPRAAFPASTPMSGTW